MIQQLVNILYYFDLLRWYLDRKP